MQRMLRITTRRCRARSATPRRTRGTERRRARGMFVAARMSVAASIRRRRRRRPLKPPRHVPRRYPSASIKGTKNTINYPLHNGTTNVEQLYCIRIQSNGPTHLWFDRSIQKSIRVVAHDARASRQNAAHPDKMLRRGLMTTTRATRVGWTAIGATAVRNTTVEREPREGEP